MKTERGETFSPIKITIETKEEALVFLGAARVVDQDAIAKIMKMDLNEPRVKAAFESFGELFNVVCHAVR